MQDYELTPEAIRKKIDGWLWSFSRVGCVSQCMYGAYLHYVEEHEDIPNCWAQFGSLVHKILEMYLKKELDVFSVLPYYEEHYDEYVTCEFPPNQYVDLGEKAYEQGREYFANLNFNFDKYEVLDVEQEYRFKVGKYPFRGFVDAVYRDRDTGEIILRDHKTSSFKYLKNGSISKSNAEQFKHYRYQELLYCIPLIEKYGKVDWLSWNMIRDKKIIQIPFDKNEFEEAQEWTIKNIEMLENETLWLPDTSNPFMCRQLCGQRSRCIYKP